MEQIADKEIIKSEDIDLTVRQEKRMLDDVRSDLVLVLFKLGDKTRFKKLFALVDEAAMEANREAVAADDYLNERM
jgi:hypothetical protein